MISLQDLINELDSQEALRDAFEMNLDSIIAGEDIEMISTTNTQLPAE